MIKKESTSLFLGVLCAVVATFSAAFAAAFAPNLIARWRVGDGQANENINGVPTDPPKVMLNFTLTNQNGGSTSLSDFKGKPTFVFFGYTYCPDICPVTMSDFKKVRQQLGADAANVNFVMISVDGERDTPVVLKRYVEAFDPSFVGLTGDEAAVTPVAADYGAYFTKTKVQGTQASYLVGHTSYVYLLDGQGRWRITYPFGSPTDGMLRDARLMLKEG